MWKFLLSYLVLLELISLVSIVLIFIVFFLCKWCFHMDESKWLHFFSTHMALKIIGLMLLSECLSLLVITPLSFYWFHKLQIAYADIAALSIPIVTILPFLCKVKAAYKMIKEKKEKTTIPFDIYL